VLKRKTDLKAVIVLTRLTLWEIAEESLLDNLNLSIRLVEMVNFTSQLLHPLGENVRRINWSGNLFDGPQRLI
jgi:hypothetical protein